jgi:mono/diheme cytochrome c family protein
MRHPDGTWGGFTYEWDAQQTDATLVTGGAVRTIDGQPWIFPSEAQCVQCHTAAAGRALGLETAQLNKDFVYTHTNRTANQLATLNALGTLTPPITDAAAQPSMPDPADANAPPPNRARAYLHTNCAQCHRPNGPTPSSMDLRYTTTLAATNACNASPQQGDLGLGTAARLIAPGSAGNSIIVARTNRRDAPAMPPVGSHQVDAAGVTLLTQWINGLAGCL